MSFRLDWSKQPELKSMSTISTEQPQLHLGPDSSGALLALDEFDAAEFEAGYRCELDIYTTGLLPGFELPVGKLLEQADRWE
jgi:hypothetical protein